MNATIASRVKTAVTVILTAILVFVLFVSRDHITQTAYTIGLRGYQANTLFVLIDIVALIGKVLMLKYFARSTRKLGMWMLCTSGSLSLACNVFAGHNLGERIYGAFIVILFVALEQVVTKIKPAASVKAAATKAANAVVIAQATPAAATIATVRISGTGRKCQAGCTCKRHGANRPAVATATQPAQALVSATPYI